MKKNWTKIAVALGPAIIIASVFWEVARTKPDYKFVVSPWALRGTEMIHGDVFLALGISLLVVALLTAWEGSLRPTVSASIVGLIVVAATVVAFVYADDDFSLNVNPVTAIILSIMLAAGVSMALRSLFGAQSRWFKRAIPVFAVSVVVIGGIIALTVMNTVIEVPTWQAVFVVFLALGGLSLAIRPLDMGANRMLIIATVATWMTITASGGAMRQTLIDNQTVADAAAQYKDTQAAAGWWLAGMGVTIAFVGAVGIWARRRDLVASLARARKQRAAAETSAREIREAQEAYEQEQAALAGS